MYIDKVVFTILFVIVFYIFFYEIVIEIVRSFCMKHWNVMLFFLIIILNFNPSLIAIHWLCLQKSAWTERDTHTDRLNTFFWENHFFWSWKDVKLMCRALANIILDNIFLQCSLHAIHMRESNVQLKLYKIKLIEYDYFRNCNFYEVN